MTLYDWISGSKVTELLRITFESLIKNVLDFFKKGEFKYKENEKTSKELKSQHLKNKWTKKWTNYK
jgi:hypothetical protein